MDLTTRSQQALSAAVKAAAERGNPATEPAHVLVALLDDAETLVRPALQSMGVDPLALRASAQQLVDELPSASGASVGAPQSSRGLLTLLGAAEREARNRSDEFVSAESLLLGLTEQGGDEGAARRSSASPTTRSTTRSAALRGSKRVTSPDPEGTFQALAKYGVDLTAAARDGKIDPVIGRDNEIRRVVQVLSAAGPRTTPSSSASPASARPPSSRASPSASSPATSPTRCAARS